MTRALSVSLSADVTILIGTRRAKVGHRKDQGKPKNRKRLYVRKALRKAHSE